MPLPVFGQVNYDREASGEAESFIHQVTPRAGGDSFVGDHDLQDRSQYGLGSGMRNPFYELAENDNSVFTNEEFLNKSKASYSHTNVNRSKDASEVYHQRSEAQKEHDSHRDETCSNQDYFIRTGAHFAQIDPNE